MKRKSNKIDVDELNKKIIKKKMKNSLCVLNEMDLISLNQPYKKKLKNNNKWNHAVKIKVTYKCPIGPIESNSTEYTLITNVSIDTYLNMLKQPKWYN